MGETRKRLALAIIDHLQSEVKDGTISSDMEESVEGVYYIFLVEMVRDLEGCCLEFASVLGLGHG